MNLTTLVKNNACFRGFYAKKLPAVRAFLIILPVLALTQCFQITQVLDWRDDGAMDLRWMFRYSKTLDQAQSQQGQDKKNSESLTSQVEKAKKEIPGRLKHLVKNLEVKKIDNEFDSGIEVSFQVANYARFPFHKLQKEDFPMIPQYLPEKKQIVFHFKPMKKNDDQAKKDKAGDATKGGTTEGTGSDGGKADSGEQLGAMGKQITQLFLSSVRYQIFLGKRFNPEKIYLKKGSEEKNIEMQKILGIVMIDIPLFALFGEKEEPFEVIVQMR